MISSITKSKIPNDFSYVLKTSQLEEILGRENIITDVTLEYWKPQIIGSIFEVHYWLPNENNSFNRLYIRAGAILKKDVYNASKRLNGCGKIWRYCKPILHDIHYSMRVRISIKIIGMRNTKNGSQ